MVTLPEVDTPIERAFLVVLTSSMITPVKDSKYHKKWISTDCYQFTWSFFRLALITLWICAVWIIKLVSTNRFSRSISFLVTTRISFWLCSIYSNSINMTVSRFDGRLDCTRFTVDTAGSAMEYLCRNLAMGSWDISSRIELGSQETVHWTISRRGIRR